MQLRSYQEAAVTAIENEWGMGRKRTLLVLPTGCHAHGENLLMADGKIRPVDDIFEGDLLMGPDGTPRRVLARTEGTDEMYRITPVKGRPFLVTAEHELSLVKTNLRRIPKYPCEYTGGQTVDVSVKEYLGWSRYRKHIHKLFRSRGIEHFSGWRGGSITVDPYFLGVLLGDGGLKYSISVTTQDPEIAEVLQRQAQKYGMTLSERPAGRATTYTFRGGDAAGCKGSLLHRQLCEMDLRGGGSGDKFVPHAYKTADAPVRKQVVAGLLDSDGSYTVGGYDFISKSEQLANDLAFMCRSLGLAAYVTKSIKSCPGYRGTYFRVSISGDCSVIPCRVRHKQAPPRKQKKDVLRTSFRVESIGVQPFIGFTVDGDNHYLMHDFTVTHNCGKTVVFSSVVNDRVSAGDRVLILAHRGELLDQAADKLKKAFGIDSVLEKAESTAYGSFIPVTVGSVQTLCRDKRLDVYPEDYFGTIVVDEAHHAMSDTYQKVLGHFSKANILGVTATPDRADQKNLGRFFDSKAYEYSMSQAIREHYLCPVKAQMIPLELNISEVSTSSGDYAAGEIGEALEPYLEQIADEMQRYCRDRKTVVFLPLVKTSQKFRGLLAEKGFRAAEVNGNSPDRAEILADFEAGRYDVLCNSMLLTEGWDCPAVDCVVILRPTKVRSLYQQMVGRGMRLSPGKDHLLLLDFLWLSEKHSLCRPSSLISPNDEISRRIDGKVRDSAAGIDLLEAEEQAQKDVIADRERSLAQQLSDMRTRKRQLVDPLQYAMSIEAEDLTMYTPTFAWEMGPASPKQLEFLEKRGIFPESVENAGKASMIIDRLVSRQNEGLSTPKQIRLLERYGFRRVGTWRFEDANKLITRIAANGWQIPRGIIASKYIP